MKIGLLIDDMKVAEWQRRALVEVASRAEFVVYNCSNTRFRHRLRHVLYYALNLFTVRNALTRRCDLPRELHVVDTHNFCSEYEGAWQRLPPEVVQAINCDGLRVIIKFGMGLLRIPEREKLPCAILSYHHGNPATHRGRPAGFYELLGGQEVMGQVIQKLSNDLDSGQVVALAETKVFQHSYRATLVEAFRKSPLLLKSAIDNALRGVALDCANNGPIYRLPNSFQVLRLIGHTLRGTLKRFCYGALFEKAWHVSTAPADALELLSGQRDFPPSSSWLSWPRPRGYSFVADPFFPPEGDGLFVEGLRAVTGRGEILRLTATGAIRISDRADHFSYPASVCHEGTPYLIPEISNWSGPLAFPIAGDRINKPVRLDVGDGPRLLDPTLVKHDSHYFLFGNRSDEGPGVLRLWFADALFGRFVEHPRSPIRISPNGSRMAGEILTSGNALFRFGQRWERGYGDGVLAFQIHELSCVSYQESLRREFRFHLQKGPHTINFRGGEVAFDWYNHRLTPLAGVRRVASALS